MAPDPIRSARPRLRPPARASAGLTLIEVAIALAVLALLASLAMPAWGRWIARQELANRAQMLSTALTRTRTEAIRRGHRVNLCKTADATTCADGGAWTTGWLIHDDYAAEGHPGAGEPPIAYEPPPGAPITVVGNRPVDDYVSFTPLGEPRRLNGALQMGTFTVCRPGHDAIQVVLAATGRVRTVRTRMSCP